MSNVIKYKLLSDIARAPTKGSEGAAAYDLYSSVEMFCEIDGTYMIPTGISLQIPKGYYGQIFGRSGLAVNKSIGVLGGVIDEDYRGEVKVLLKTHEQSLKVNVGDRIAQMVILPVPKFELVNEDLDETTRGEKGFGSTSGYNL
jgi:dUTP pyrophosphatase